jgi:hypothetical protein
MMRTISPASGNGGTLRNPWRTRQEHHPENPVNEATVLCRKPGWGSGVNGYAVLQLGGRWFFGSSWFGVPCDWIT